MKILGKSPEGPPPSWIREWGPADVAPRAECWPRVRQRAEQSGLGDFSLKRYGFLCNLAHADAWSSLTYVEDGGEFQVFMQPSATYVELAFSQVAELLPPLTEYFCRAFGIVAQEQPPLRVLRQLANAVPMAEGSPAHT